MPGASPKHIAVLTLVCVTLIAAVPRKAHASPDDRVGEKLKDATLRDMFGREAQLLSFHKGKTLVIAYTGLGCPISQRYAPRLMQLYEKFRDKGVTFVGINANPHDKRKAIAKEAKKLGIKFPILQDKGQELTRQLDAKTTTEVFVVDSDMVIRYRGMIDDQYALGEKRAKPKTKYLEKAIAAARKNEFPHVNRTAAPGCVITRKTPAKSQGKSKSDVTYARHVARIVQDNCVSCHRPGQVGPFSLTSYEQLTGWSAMIEMVVDDGRMPPWNADEEFDGHFSNERKLTKKEKATLLAWIKDGMPRGDPKKEPAQPKWPKQWRIGKPDRVYHMKDTFLVPKDGTVAYQYFEVPTDFKEDKWIVAMEAHPGAPEVVHHIVAFVMEPGKKADLNRLGLEEGFLCATVPGDTPSIFPPGCAKRLPAGANIVFQLHYTTSGKAQRDKSSIGLKFAKGPVDREVRTRGIYNMSFEIPPGEGNHEVRSEFTTAEDMELLSFFPHMHTRGKDWAYVAHLPDGKEMKLLSVSHYDFNWQESYALKEPLFIPKGTRLECVAHFDNSESNFENPDSTQPVKWGEQTWEEMMIGYIDWIPSKKGAEATAMATP